MTNSRASAGVMQLVEKYTSPSALATKTFTFSLGNISYLLLIIKGEATAAFTMRIRINSVASATHNFDSVIASAGTITGGAGSEGRIATSAKTIVADKSFSIETKIFVNPIGTLHGTYIAHSVGDNIHETNAGSNQTDTSSHTTLIVEASTSSWKTGTTMELYKVLT